MRDFRIAIEDAEDCLGSHDFPIRMRQGETTGAARCHGQGHSGGTISVMAEESLPLPNGAWPGLGMRDGIQTDPLSPAEFLSK